MTGGRASKVIFDDIEVPNNSLTEAKREILTARSKEMGGAILMPKIGQSIGLGTPQSVQTVYNGFEERGYKIQVWPARFPQHEELETYGDRLAPSITDALRAHPELVGRPVDPDRFDEEDLLEREAEYGRSGFALQFQLNTTLSDANKYPLKFRDLVVMDTDKDVAPARVVWASGPQQELKGVDNVGITGDRYFMPLSISETFTPYEGSVMFIDPSGRGRDETAYVVLKSLNGFLYVRRWGGLTGGYDEATLQTLAEIAKSEKVNEVWTESNFGDGMFNGLFGPVLNKVYPCLLDEYRVSGQKELRIIDKLEPVMNSHRLVVDKKLVEQQLENVPKDAGDRARYYNGFFQMAYLTKDRGSLKQDNRLDVLAEAVGYFTASVSRDTERAAEKKREAALKAELKEFMKTAKRGAREVEPAGLRGTQRA